MSGQGLSPRSPAKDIWGAINRAGHRRDVSIPKRVQISRQQPWRADNPDAVIVSRPHRFGNPIRAKYGRCGLQDWRTDTPKPGYTGWYVTDENDVIYQRWLDFGSRIEAQQEAVRIFEELLHLRAFPFTVDDIRSKLHGHDLACWCPIWDKTRQCLTCDGAGTQEIAYGQHGQAIAWASCEVCEGTGFTRCPCHADVFLRLANPEIVFPWEMPV